jgi:hypothetical protein
MLAPPWYHFRYDRSHDAVEGIMVLGDPLLWLAFVPALAWGVQRAWRTRDAGLAFVAGLALALWLPWSLTSRPTTFSSYMLEALPFGAIAIAAALAHLAGPRRFSTVAGVYVAVAALWLGWWHPLQTMALTPVPAYAQHLLLPDWDHATLSRHFRERHGLEDNARWEAFLRTLGNRTYGGLTRKGRR